MLSQAVSVGHARLHTVPIMAECCAQRPDPAASTPCWFPASTHPEDGSNLSVLPGKQAPSLQGSELCTVRAGWVRRQALGTEGTLAFQNRSDCGCLPGPAL